MKAGQTRVCPESCCVLKVAAVVSDARLAHRITCAQSGRDACREQGSDS